MIFDPRDERFTPFDVGSLIRAQDRLRYLKVNGSALRAVSWIEAYHERCKVVAPRGREWIEVIESYLAPFKDWQPPQDSQIQH